MDAKSNFYENKEIKEISKRDGRTVTFNEDKIVKAIEKAFCAVHDRRTYSLYKDISDEVVNELYAKELYCPSVEEIQDIVEKTLIKRNYSLVAKEYILYRSERNRAREMNGKLMNIYKQLTFFDAKASDIKRENANIDGNTAMGSMLKYGSEGAKQFYEMFMLKPEHSKAHHDGDIHIHDLDFYSLTTTCCQIDLLKLFKNGFSTGHGTLREPNSILSYSSLACIAIQSNQNDQHGGQSVPNFDYAMAEGIKKTFIKQYRLNLAKALELIAPEFEITDLTYKDMQTSILKTGVSLRLMDYENYLTVENEALKKLGISEEVIERAQSFSIRNASKNTERETYQAMEAFIHNLNTMHSRAGAQTPFSSINYGTDVSPEGRMAIKNILKALDAGLGNGETPIFPIHIFRIKDGINFNPGETNYDLFKLACKVSGKRLFPNFSFQDAPFNLEFYDQTRPETEIAYMGCRTRVMANVYNKDNEVTYGRGNLSFTSINLPRLGIEAKGDIIRFFSSLDAMLELCTNQLLERLKVISKKSVKNFPFLMGEGVWIGSDKLNFEDNIEEILKNGTLSIGFIGLAECLKALVGKHHGEDERARELGLNIIKHMREFADQKCDEYSLNFSIIATPAEGLSGRFVAIDKEIYGEIGGVTDREYYTNSFHVPVYYEISALDKIKIEAPYHALTNGGHISYVELDGDASKNVEAFEAIIRYMKECGMGYGSINHPVDRDPVCGYQGIIGDRCPNCGRDDSEIPFERIRRITGYLVGSLDRFNNAKLAEVRDRVKHQ